MMLNSDEADGGVFIVSGVVLSQEMEQVFPDATDSLNYNDQ